MGNFNYSYEKRSDNGKVPGIPLEWTDLLDSYYSNCFKDNTHYTFRRGFDASTIDYIFCSNAFADLVSKSSQIFVSNKWTDHALLTVTFQFTSNTQRGPGAWKANPFLARLPEFRSALIQHLEAQQSTVTQYLKSKTPQQVWDWLKSDIQTFIRLFQLQRNKKRRRQLVKL